MRVWMFSTGVYMHSFNIFITWYRHYLPIFEYLILCGFMCIFDEKRKKFKKEWEQLLY